MQVVPWGQVTEISTDKEITISRNIISRMAPIQGLVGSLSLDHTSWEMWKDCVLTLAYVKNYTTDPLAGVSWTSSNPDVATVSSSGTVRGVAPGETIVTETDLGDGSQSSCKVTIVPAPERQTVSNRIVCAMNDVAYVVCNKDGSEAELVYLGQKPEVAMGDEVSFNASLTTYNGVLEWTDLTEFTLLSQGNSFTLPEPKDLTPLIKTYDSTQAEYLMFRGRFTQGVSGSSPYVRDLLDSHYYVSLFSFPETFDQTEYAGYEVLVKGFYVGRKNNGSQIRLIATEITVL